MRAEDAEVVQEWADETETLEFLVNALVIEDDVGDVVDEDEAEDHLLPVRVRSRSTDADEEELNETHTWTSSRNGWT